MMITGTLLAASMASGIILPAQTDLHVPPKPAIVKPGNIESGKNLLAMPFTLGMLKRASSITVGPPIHRAGYSNTSSISPHSLANVALGTASANRLVVVISGSGGAYGQFTTCTVGSTLLTRILTRSNSTAGVYHYMWAGIVSSGTSATVTCGGAQGNFFCGFQVYTIELNGASPTPVDTYTASSTSVTSTSAGTNLSVPVGGVALYAIAGSGTSGPNWTWGGPATEGGTEISYSNTGRVSTASRSTSGNTAVVATGSLTYSGAFICAAWGG